MTYQPHQKVLEKYADLLVNFALGNGKGIKKGDVVYLVSGESAKPLMVEARKAILRSGGHIISSYHPDNEPGKYNLDKDFYLLAQDHHLSFFPSKFYRGLVDQIDHMLFIDSETDKQSLKEIDPKKLMKRGLAFKSYNDWRDEKENNGKLSWIIGLYGTEAMAKEANLSQNEYWNQIIKACYLDKPDPNKEWKIIFHKIQEYIKKLNNLQADKFNITGPDVNLWIKLGENRRWKGGAGSNMPSFEIFTSPDWRGTSGWIKFNQPLYSFGNVISGIELEFKNGQIIRAKAKKNEKLLKELVKTRGGNKIGEFSLTDKRFSRITKFMAETLYDENISGPYGNMHIAIGKSFHDCYKGDLKKMKMQQGFIKL